MYITWVKMLKFWASLRFNDLQWLAPASMVVAVEGLRASLPRTKTSGRGILTATISSDAPDLPGVRDCYASSDDAAVLSQALYNELRRPVLSPERGW